MSKVWNLPNMLSMFRILLVIPMGFALWYQENVIAVMLGFLSGFTDNLDGYLARRMNQITELGKMLDPLADKLLVGIIGIILLMQLRMPVWFAILFWGRDLLLMLGGLWARKKVGLVIPSDWVGKLTYTLLAFTLMLMILNLDSITYWGLWITSTMLVYSFIHYTIRMLLFIKRKNKEESEINNNLDSINQQ